MPQTDFQRAFDLASLETELAASMEAYRRAKLRGDLQGMAEAHKRDKEARLAILRAGSERD